MQAGFWRGAPAPFAESIRRGERLNAFASSDFVLIGCCDFENPIFSTVIREGLLNFLLTFGCRSDSLAIRH